MRSKVRSDFFRVEHAEGETQLDIFEAKCSAVCASRIYFLTCKELLFAINFQ